MRAVDDHLALAVRKLVGHAVLQHAERDVQRLRDVPEIPLTLLANVEEQRVPGEQLGGFTQTDGSESRSTLPLLSKV